MATIARLSITGLRNLAQVELYPSPGINLVFGPNGAGKTSLLEALYMLGVGKSFRNHQIRPVITDGAQKLTLFAETSEGDSLGVERNPQGSPEIRLNGKPAANLADLSYALPVQLINTDTLNILEGAPQERRRFLDWGVFHVEHGFLQAWKRARLALRQRNALLKQGAPHREIEPWSLSLAQAGNDVEVYRASYMEMLSVQFHALIAGVQGLPTGQDGANSITLDYRCGWNQALGLDVQLKESLDKDRRQGFTSAGPHRADIIFRSAGKELASIYSRGQLKLVVCLLKIAQAKLLFTETGKRGVFLVDDLPAELDASNRGFVCRQLKLLGAQTFMTSIDQEPLYTQLSEQGIGFGSKEGRLFHVKHGIIMPFQPE